MSRTGTIAGLFAHEPEPRVMVHPEDLSRAGINEGDLVNVLSRRGHIYLQAAADPGLMRGLVFIPMHRSEEHTSELQSLTNLVCRLLLEKKKKRIWRADARDYSLELDSCRHPCACLHVLLHAMFPRTPMTMHNPKPHQSSNHTKSYVES